MSLRFTVAVEPLTKEQERLFREYVVSSGGTWWHWISNFWLVKFPDESEIDAEVIWNVLIKLNPEARIYIDAVKHTDWTVTDIQKGKGRMAAWLEKNWMDDED